MITFTKSSGLVDRNAIWKHFPDELKRIKENNMCQCETPPLSFSPNSVYFLWENIFQTKDYVKITKLLVC